MDTAKREHVNIYTPSSQGHILLNYTISSGYICYIFSLDILSDIISGLVVI